MNKHPLSVCILITMVSAFASAQDVDTGLFAKPDSPVVDNGKNIAAQAIDAGKKMPTEITATQEATLDAKARMAVFLGAVHIKDAQFTLDADKLTVYFKKPPQPDGAKTWEGKGAATKTPDHKTGATPGATPGLPQGGGGLEKAIAEGDVVIVKDQPDANGGAPVHYVGKAAKVEYNAVTGDAILSGWPQVQQGINMHAATAESTVMYLNREGRMRTEGGSKTVITDPGPDKKSEVK